MGYPTTVKGKAFWTYAFTPDTKFDSDGVYTTKFRIGGEAAVAFQQEVDKLSSQAVEKAKEDNPTKKIKVGSVPYSEVLDENGNETGQLEFVFKQKATINTKNGPMNMRVAVFDAKGKPITEPVEIGNGSTVKVAYEPNLWYVPSTGAGVTLRFKGLQVIDLLARAGGDGAEGFGFGEEDGYSHTNNNNNSDDDDGLFEEEIPKTSSEEEDF